MKAAGGLAGRAGWGVADQALSSLANFAMGVIIARTTSADEFGAFTLAFSTYLIVLNLGRAIATQPLTIRYTGTEPVAFRRRAEEATGTLVATGLLAIVVIAPIGALLPAPLGPALIAAAFAMPLLLLQDAWRAVLFSAARARAAFVVDLAWAAVVVPVLLVASMLDPLPPAGMIAAWGAATIPSSLLGIALTRAKPRPGAVRSWLASHADLAGRYAAETATGLVLNQLSIFIVGAIAGLAGAGAIRAAQLLLGPLHVLVQAAFLVAVPEAIRIRASHPGRFLPAVGTVSGGLALVTVGWLGFLLLLPDAFGAELLGDSWDAARLTLLPLGLSLVGQAIGAGPVIGMRALADARASLRVRLIDAPASFILAVSGAMLGGAVGAAWGFAVGGAISAALLILFFRGSWQRAGSASRGESAQPVP